MSMYGMKQESKTAFAFDLEKEIKEKPTVGTELLAKAERRIQEIKNQLRKGVEKKGEFDELGILLHGYTALQKVLKKIAK